MEVVKKTKEYTVYKKKSGRYGVQGPKNKWINGDEKVKILLAEGLVKVPEPKKEAPAATVEESTEDAAAPAAE